MKIGDLLEKGAGVSVWIYKAESYRRLEKNVVMRKFRNFADSCMLLGDAIKDELNEQRTVRNRKT
jgi:hypothetical protein